MSNKHKTLESWNLKLPLIAAPMFLVSTPELVMATCREGVIGTFPTANCRTSEQLESWLDQINEYRKPTDAPFAVNLIMQRENVHDEVECLIKHNVELVITSVGSPLPVLPALQESGCLVLSDVASIHHAKRAVDAGVDGLILLSAGAGGNTGWANGLAFARAVRQFFDGILVLAGGVADGWSLLAAEAVGCDLGYMGTRFIAAEESSAKASYRDMLVECSLDDVMLTKAFTGLESNMLRPSVEAVGLDPDNLPTDMAATGADAPYGGKKQPARWVDIWSAGHTVSSVTSIQPAAAIIENVREEYNAAREAIRS